MWQGKRHNSYLFLILNVLYSYILYIIQHICTINHVYCTIYYIHSHIHHNYANTKRFFILFTLYHIEYDNSTCI